MSMSNYRRTLAFFSLRHCKMPLYLTREAPKLWRKICTETSIELKLLFENWKYLLGGIIFQVLCGLSVLPNTSANKGVAKDSLKGEIYIHGLAARGVHYLHRPGPLLHDIGFNLIPELGQEKGYISEAIFAFMFISFLLWTFHPFIYQNKKIYTVLLWCRVLTCLVASQILRIVTFYSTQLPGPNYHCREGSKLSQLPPPRSAIEVLLINFPRGVFYGCGDLIFSSHMIFTLTFVSTYQKHGMKRFVKQCAWWLAVVQSVLIVASRKHYTVDIVVAWYTVTLVIFFIDKKLPELPDRSMGSSQQMLPVISKDKEAKSKEEQYNLLNGITVNGATD